MSVQEKQLQLIFPNMRYRELDIARGFTVLMMPAVHVTMLYGNESVYNSWWGYLLNWIATMPGAQLFMLLMGMSYGFSAAKNPPRLVLIKFSRWLMLSYALNFLKFIVPAVAGWLPGVFYFSLGLSQGVAASFRLFLVGDILQLAAFSLGIIYLVNRFALSIKSIILISAVFILLSPMFWKLHLSNPFFNELASLATGNDPLVFFPFFPWAIFPLIGLVLGRLLQSGLLKYTRLFLTGLFLMLPEIILYGAHFTQVENLYRPNPVQAIYHLGFCFIWLGFCAFISASTELAGGPRLLNFCSKRITLIYCIQWIAIFWCISILPYRGLSLIETITMSLLLSFIVFLLTHLLSNKYNS